MPRPATPDEVKEFQQTSWFCRPENQPIIEEWIAESERADPHIAEARESSRRDPNARSKTKAAG